MAHHPKFSLVLPTKNRPNLAEKTISSVIAQNFQDWDLVVVDNGDTPLPLDSSWRSDPRIRVHRTGGLIMCDNWQAGYEQAKGDYVFLIEDKMVLFPESLEVLHEVFLANNCDYCTFAIATDTTSFRSADAPGSKVYPLDVTELIDVVADCRLDHYSKIAPRTINTVFRRSYAESVSVRVGRLFRPMSPDYSCGALLLSGAGLGVHFPRALACFTPGPSFGNAYASGGKKGELAVQEFGGSIQDLVRRLPCQSPLFGNTLLGELLDFLEAGGIPWSRLEPRKIPYWLMLVSEALVAKKMENGRQHEASECFSEIRSKAFPFRLQLTWYLLQRFRKGWPNRKLKMRNNLPEVCEALKALWFFGQKTTACSCDSIKNPV